MRIKDAYACITIAGLDAAAIFAVPAFDQFPAAKWAVGTVGMVVAALFGFAAARPRQHVRRTGRG